jgi:outer membrane lipoprotein-sorting protein
MNLKNISILFLLTFNFAFAQAQTADDIIDKSLDAVGGKDKLASIKTLYKEGTINARGNIIQMKSWNVNKADMRAENVVGGMMSYTIIRTDSGWSYSPRRGQKTPEPLTRDAVKLAQFGLDIQSPLLNYKEKGYTLKYLGKSDEVDGSDAYKLELTVNDSLRVTYFIDPDSYFIMRTKTISKQNGRTNTSISDYSNYHKTADGYTFPMQLNNIKYSLIKVNGDMDPSLFVPKRN